MQVQSDATIRTVDFVNGHLVFILSDGFRFKQPMSRYPGLARASAEARRAFALQQNGTRIVWESLGIRLELNELRTAR